MRATILFPVFSLLLAACASQTEQPVDEHPEITTPRPSTGKNRPTKRYGGGYYKDDGPADEIPDNLDEIPDADPKWEPLHKPAQKPYEVFGKRYTPNTAVKPYKARGIASWYGKKFHGQKTSIGEPYDMFAMTAAHTTLALPSYVRVSNPRSGKSVVVRVIDRGPFHADRIIDLSYTAAHKLGLINGGSGEVEVEAIIPGSPTSTTYAQTTPPPAVAAPSEVAVVAAPVSGIFLQLGAFANADNADNLKRHLEKELDWLTTPMLIFRSGSLHRLHLGPFASRDDATSTAARIRGSLGYQPNIVVR